MKYTLGIRAGYLIPMTDTATVLTNYFIGIDQERITCVTPFRSSLSSQCKKFLDLQDQIVLPGLINMHTHLAMTLLRGVEDNLSLQDWLFTRIFPLEGEFVDKKFVEIGTELAAYECIRFGTTTTSDMYFYPEVALKVWDKMGLRGLFSQPLISFPSPEDTKGDNTQLFQNFKKLNSQYKTHPRLQVGLAPHAPYTCQKALLQKVQQVQSETDCFVHIHVAETLAEVQQLQEQHQKSPVAYLKELGLLNPKTLFAHVVHTTPEDQKQLAAGGAAVIHNPDSNFKLGSGIAPISQYLDNKINVCLGTDGVASNNDLSMFGAMDLMAKGQKVLASDISKFTTWMALWSATRAGAKALGLAQELGQIKVGFLADLISVDMNFPHLSPLSDPVSHLVFSTQGLEVDTTIVHGKILMKNKKFSAKGFLDCRQKAQKIRQKMELFLKERTPSK